MVEKDLMERLHEIVQEHGKKWKRLSELLHDEGFSQDDGAPFTGDTLRKRYAKWLKPSGANSASKDSSKQKTPDLPDAPTQVESKRVHTADAVIPVEDLLDLFKSTLERRDAMLAGKLKNDAYERVADEKIVSLEMRLEDRLAKRLKDELAELVVEQVDRELKAMVTTGGSFERDLKLLISELLEDQTDDQLISMLDDIHITHERPPGPGRGRRGSKAKTARFSATMDEETYKSMKKLAGTFSSHLTAACQLYMRALESKRKHTK